MIGNKGKKVVVVVVFTGYEDGTCDFLQDAAYKDEFAAVEKCFKTMIGKLRDNIKGKAACPFNPDNPKVYEYHEGVTFNNTSTLESADEIPARKWMPKP